MIILASLNTVAHLLRLGSLLNQVCDGLGDAMHFETTQHDGDSSSVRIMTHGGHRAGHQGLLLSLRFRTGDRRDADHRVGGLVCC